MMNARSWQWFCQYEIYASKIPFEEAVFALYASASLDG